LYPDYKDFYSVLLYTFSEIVFTIDLILQFFIEYKIDDDSPPVRDLGKIGKRYLKGEFCLDFITIFPFELIIHP